MSILVVSVGTKQSTVIVQYFQINRSCCDLAVASAQVCNRVVNRHPTSPLLDKMIQFRLGRAKYSMVTHVSSRAAMAIQ